MYTDTHKTHIIIVKSIHQKCFYNNKLFSYYTYLYGMLLGGLRNALYNRLPTDIGNSELFIFHNLEVFLLRSDDYKKYLVSIQVNFISYTKQIVYFIKRIQTSYTTTRPPYPTTRFPPAMHIITQ